MTKLISCFSTSPGQIFRLSEMLFSMKSVRDPDQVVSGHLSRHPEEEEHQWDVGMDKPGNCLVSSNNCPPKFELWFF